MMKLLSKAKRASALVLSVMMLVTALPADILAAEPVTPPDSGNVISAVSDDNLTDLSSNQQPSAATEDEYEIIIDNPPTPVIEDSTENTIYSDVRDEAPNNTEALEAGTDELQQPEVLAEPESIDPLASDGEVTFDANGGFFWDYSGSSKTQVTAKTEYLNSDYTSYVQDPKNSDLHMAFVGWATTKGGPAVYRHSSTWDSSVQMKYVDGETTYYAVWEKSRYVITYNAGDGTFEYYDELNEESVSAATTAKLPTNPNGYMSPPRSVTPSKSNQVFDGWYDSKGNEVNSWTELTADMTVTAKYSTFYTVTLDYNGGYHNEWNSDTYEIEKKTSDIVKVPQGKRLGDGDGDYTDDPGNDNSSVTFGHWSENKDGNPPISGYLYNYVPKSDITLYAWWARKLNVTFNAGDGSFTSGNTKTYTVTEGTVYSENDSAEIPSEPTATGGKAFEGWYTDPGLTSPISNAAIKSAIISNNVTYYAKYVPSYTVTFDANGGRFASSAYSGRNTVSVQVAQGKAGGKLVPTMDTSDEHKVFEGWFSDKECTSEIKNIYTYEVDQDITLYAGWTDCYVLTFHTNKSGVTFKNTGTDTEKIRVTKGTAYRYGTSKATTDKLFSAPEMTVPSGVTISNAWYDSATGTGTKYYFSEDRHYSKANGVTSYYNMYGFIPTSDMDLYSFWDTIKVTWNANGGTFSDYEDDDRWGKLSADKTCRVIEVAKGTEFGELSHPYAFASQPSGTSGFGWGYFDSTCKDYVSRDYVLNEDTTIYVRWYKSSSSSASEHYSLTFHAGEGYFSSKTQKTTSYYVDSYYKTNYMDTPFASIEDSSKGFLQWYYDEALTKPYPAKYTRIDESGYMEILLPQKVTDLYAGYGGAYNVSFDAYGGYFDDDGNRVKDPSESMRDNTILTCKVSAGWPIKISDITKRVRRDGDMIFSGWYTDPEMNNKISSYTITTSFENFIPVSDMTLYAGWVNYEKATEVKANKTSISLAIGETSKLTATITPESAGISQDVHWYIGNYYGYGKSNKTHLTPAYIYSDGTVVGRAEGMVEAYAEVNGVRSEMVRVYVSSKTVSSSMVLSTDSLSLKTNDSTTVTANVTPTTLLDSSSVIWTSRNSEIASVEATGKNAAVITAGREEGTTTITAKIGSITKTITITVSAPLKLDKTAMVLTAKEGVAGKLIASVTSGLKVSDIVWSNSNPDAASISTEGGVTTVTPKLGLSETALTKISATLNVDGEDITLSCDVTVNPPAKIHPVQANYPSGTAVNNGDKIQLTSDTAGVQIYYTISNGVGIPEDPTAESTRYTGPIAIDLSSASVTIKAIAYKDGYIQSDISQFTYTINEDWGDADEVKATAFDEDTAVSALPDGIWYVFGSGKAIEAGKYDGSSVMTAEATGGAVTFDGDIYVFHGTRRLYQNRDYTVTYANNKAVADITAAKAPMVTIKGKGYYTGTESFKFTITAGSAADATKTPISKVKVNNLASSVEFTGKGFNINDLRKDVTKEVTLTNGTDTLGLGEDYEVSMPNYGAIGKMTITFKGIGDKYTGTVTRTVTVKAYNIKKDAAKKITVTAGDAEFRKSGSIPSFVTVYFGTDEDGYKLVEGVDYTLTFKNNTKGIIDKGAKGAPVVSVKGIGNFTGVNATATYSVTKGDPENITLMAADKAYKAKAAAGYFKVVPKITDGGKNLTTGKNKDLDAVAKTDYRYYYAEDTTLEGGIERYAGEEIPNSDIVPAGTTIKVAVTVKPTEKTPYNIDSAGMEIYGSYQILDNAYNIKSANVSLKNKTLAYDNGRVIIPGYDDLTVTLKGTTLGADDYEIDSVTNNRFLGTATIVLRGTGKYGGTKKATFKIAAKPL